LTCGFLFLFLFSFSFFFFLFSFLFLLVLQDDLARIQKEKDEKKKLDDLKKKAGEKGPLSKLLNILFFSFLFLFLFFPCN